MELQPIDRVFIIKMQLRNREITHKEARAAAKPLIDELNEKALQIAKKYKTTARIFKFENIVMR